MSLATDIKEAPIETLPMETQLAIAGLIWRNPQSAPHPIPTAEPLPQQEVKAKRKRKMPSRFSPQTGATRYLSQFPEGAPLADLIENLKNTGCLSRTDTAEKVVRIMRRNSLQFYEKPDNIWILRRFM